MGSLYGDNPDLILLDSKGNIIFHPAYSFEKFPDIGSTRYQNYWLEATIRDLVNQPWTSDGVFIDVVNFHYRAMNTSPAKYNSKQFAEAQHQFISQVIVEFHGARNISGITDENFLHLEIIPISLDILVMFSFLLRSLVKP